MTSRAKKATVAGALLVVLGALVWSRVFKIHGFIVALSPVDAEHAVVCMRANHEYGRDTRA
jgi:hypothetical protein